MLGVVRVRASQGAGVTLYSLVQLAPATPRGACYGRAKRAGTSSAGHWPV
jgi:hypothetical protein